MQDVFAAVAEVVATGGRAALVTIVRTNGSTPQRLGAKMLVGEDGRTVGTIGGGCYENDACQRALLALRDGRPFLVHYDLNDDFAEETGLICGGQMDVFIEPVVPAETLYVFGAGHVGYHVARLGTSLGFAVHVVDDRERFANRERFPDASEVVVDEIAAWCGTHPLPRGAYALVVTRGHRHDLDCLRALVSQDLRYLGLIGSKAKVARVYEQLLAEGTTADRLRAVHAPVGLDIGAVTPEEIAVAIAAEIVAVRRGKLPPGPGEAFVRSLRWEPAVLAPAERT